MKMKRVLSMLLALILMASILVGCGKQEEPAIVDDSQTAVDTPVVEQQADEQEEKLVNEVLHQYRLSLLKNVSWLFFHTTRRVSTKRTDFFL